MLGFSAPRAGHDLRRDRWIALVSLGFVAALAWVYLWREADAMSAMSGMSMPMAPDGWTFTNIGLTFLMWAIMMVGMMLPSALPAILLYGTMVRKNQERGVVLPSIWGFTLGYIAAWTVFSLVVTLGQIGLRQAALLTSDMAFAGVWLSAVILVAAGIYQWLPIKDICLDKCRHPLQFFMMRWRSGPGGAARMGIEHGVFCIGCCWVLMLLLFVAGVMNLAWVAAITGLVFAEKVLPLGRVWARAAGVGLVGWGIYLPIAA